MGIRKTPIFALMIAATTVSATAQRAPVGAAPKKEDLLESAIARLRDIPTQVTVAGQVLMPDGSAASGARLFVTLGNQFRGATGLEEIKLDATGRFRHPVNMKDQQPAEDIVFSAVVPGKAVLWRVYALNDKTLGSLTLRLEPGATLTGRVVDVNGKPRAGLDVKFPRLTPNPLAFRGAQEKPSFPLTEFLPAEVFKKLYQAKTDSEGRFTVSGLPQAGQLFVKLGGGVIPAPGSAAPIELGDPKQVDAGILVAVAPGSLAVHVTDRLTGKPATATQVMVLPKNLTSQNVGRLADEDEEENRQARMSGLATDAHGDVALPKIAPGEYRILVAGTDRLIKVTEGQHALVDFSVRTGPLKGRIVDAAGKPVAGVPITLDMTPDPLKDLNGGFNFAEGSRGGSGIATTDKNGRFEIPFFPWESTAVTLRGTQGNAEAQWSGSARNLGKALELHMRPDALITVTGRLVDPQYKQVKSKSVSLIRWQDAPRITWLTSATQVQVDAQGRFQVKGLRRGEGFSLLSGSPFSGGDPSGAGFESPRFTTNRTGVVQSLGDVVVHPLDSGEQVLQIYGLESRQQLAQLAALVHAPSGDAVAGAREAMIRYRSAIVSGDFDAVHQLTSPISAGWSQDRAEFMAQAALHTASQEEMQPLRYVPGISLAYLLAIGKAGLSTFNFSFGTAARDLQANPDWVVFASGGPAAVRIAGIAHREQGAWKVVSAPSIFGDRLEGLFLIDATGGGIPPRAAGFRKPAATPETAQIEAARAVGEKYLAAWSHGDDTTQLALTSPLAAGAATNLVGLRKARSQRVDEGVCPISDMSTLQLTPLTGLTQWESEWLAEYARKFDELSGQSRGADRVEAEKLQGFPGKYVERGDMIPFSYSVDGRDFLILMVKHAKGWQVLEPAVPQ